MKAKVFVSSTCYDLVDIRAELETMLREIGMDPVLSDSATSEFEVDPKANSIETCLANVRTADYAIVVLSRRYGRSLAKAGYPDISATHLEYLTAIEAKRPVFFYVRDTLHGVYEHWRATGKRAVEHPWLSPSNDPHLLAFIAERAELAGKDGPPNWIQVFRNSVDLKQLVAKDLRIPASRASLEAAVRENRIPILHASVRCEIASPTDDLALVNLTIKNTGTVPAYRVQRVINNERYVELPIMAPGGDGCIGFEVHLPYENQATISYRMPDGHSIVDTFMIRAIAAGRYLTSGATLFSKVYAPSLELPYTIADPLEPR